MKHVAISEKPPTKRRLPAGKAVLKTSVQSVRIVRKQSKSSLKNNELKVVKKIAAKKTVPATLLIIKKNAPVKSHEKAKIKVVGTPKSKAESAKTGKTAAAQVSAKRVQTTVSKRNLKTEAAQVKVIAGVKAAKPKNQKSKLAATTKKTKIAAVEKSRIVLKSPAKKTQPVIAAKKIVVKNRKSKSFAPVAETKPAGKKVKAIAAAKKSSAEIIGKIKKLKSSDASEKVTVKKAEVIENNPKPEKVLTAQMLKKMAAELIISAKANRIRAQIRTRKIASVIQSKKPVIVENVIEETAAPLPAKPKTKKAKLIGAAIFRGKKERYDFQVFPVDGEFEDAAAIFIISKRTVDKRKKAHHTMICIGQTTSVVSELKKHRKGKCFKKYEANAISVLREENEQKRQKIELDLKSAHTIPCPHA